MTYSTTKVVTEWRGLVSQAALAFESRWTMASLRRQDPELAEALHDQINLFTKECIVGLAPDIQTHGEAAVRGYAQAVKAMHHAHIEDDAYMLGTDLVTGTKVAIGTQKAAAQRVREIHGNSVIWLTPDECARMFAGTESFKTIGAVKQMFPGAEVIDRYPNESSREDEAVFEHELDKELSDEAADALREAYSDAKG